MSAAPQTNSEWLTASDLRIARFAALAAAIHVLEAGIPSPVPGVKLGLANIVTLIVLLRHGWRPAVAVTLLRIALSSIVLGTLFSPTFWLSLAGGLAALICLYPLWLWRGLAPNSGPGPVGLSLIAACAHIQAQFWLAWAWFVPHPGLFSLLPLLQAAAIISGTTIGLLTQRILQRMEQLQQLSVDSTLPDDSQRRDT